MTESEQQREFEKTGQTLHRLFGQLCDVEGEKSQWAVFIVACDLAAFMACRLSDGNLEKTLELVSSRMETSLEKLK